MFRCHYVTTQLYTYNKVLQACSAILFVTTKFLRILTLDAWQINLKKTVTWTPLVVLKIVGFRVNFNMYPVTVNWFSSNQLLSIKQSLLFFLEFSILLFYQHLVRCELETISQITLFSILISFKIYVLFVCLTQFCRNSKNNGVFQLWENHHYC